MTKPFSEKFNIPTIIIDRKALKQAKCSHPKWRKVCSCCGKQFSSEILGEDKQTEEIII